MWQVRLSRALRAVTGCVKTHVVQFAEAERFSHVHFHVIPRMADLPFQRRGP
jgi:diadenosine tetraphosphate (Ap4A) HIT family hydrolase